jgi:hypothetical protein
MMRSDFLSAYRRRMADVWGDMEGREEEAYFELNFSPNVRLVSTVRRFVSEFYVQVLGDAELTSRLAVATHELLDNAVRYSSDGQSSLRIGIRRVVNAPFDIAIATRNRSTKANLAALKGAVDEMNAARDRLLHYQVLMRRSAKRTEGSGLGLGRIYAEADMQISCRIDEDNETAFLQARTQIAKEGS